ADIVEALQQAILREVVQWKGRLKPHCRRGYGAVPDVDLDLEVRVLGRRLEELRPEVGIDLNRYEPALGGVVSEDIPEPWRDHRLDPIVHQRPDGMLAGRANAEVRPGDENARSLELGTVQHEVLVALTPRGEEPLAEARALHA